MTRSTKSLLAAAALITLACVVVWQATGGDYYTKFSVVEDVQTSIDPDDPLAATGFYGDSGAKETVRRDEFRFGLLPTPQDLIDKHIISVASVSGPLWIGTLGLVWWNRRRNNTPDPAIKSKNSNIRST